MKKSLLLCVVLLFGLQFASAHNFSVEGKVTYADDIETSPNLLPNNW